MFVPVSRIISMLMGAVLCFGMLVPLALKEHHESVAIGVGAVFVVYLIANVVLWQRNKRRSA